MHTPIRFGEQDPNTVSISLETITQDSDYLCIDAVSRSTENMGDPVQTLHIHLSKNEVATLVEALTRHDGNMVQRIAQFRPEE